MDVTKLTKQAKIPPGDKQRDPLWIPDITFLSHVLLISSSLHARACPHSVQVCICVHLKVIPKITMTSDSRVEISGRVEEGKRQAEVEEGSLETCAGGLLLQRRLIRADKGEIRRFEIEKVVCGRCTERGWEARWENKQVGGGGREAEQRGKSEIKM